MNHIAFDRQLPNAITVKHGTESTSKVLGEWCYLRGARLDFIVARGLLRRQTASARDRLDYVGAARTGGLASLCAQANEFDIATAKAYRVEWTPRAWMRPDLDLSGFEQQLYLRESGYGASNVTGKDLIDEPIKDRARQLGKAFTVRRFFDELHGAGPIPVSMIHRQLTGQLDPTLSAALRQKLR
jgi:hypothetical protein